MIKPKVKAENLPKLVRRFERATLYISQKSSAIAYNTGIYYLQQVADAITYQNFPGKPYTPLSDFTIDLKRIKGFPNPHVFWVDSGKLLEDVMLTRPKVVGKGNKVSYRIEFSPETSEKIYHVETEGVSQMDSTERIKRPLFMPIFHNMKDKMIKEGRKVLMDIVKDRERRTGVKW